MTSTLGIKKIQYPNGTNIATLDSSGSIAFAGASTVAGTLGVTGAITGTLATAAQTNITSVGTLTSFRSTGIDDNADALAMTIDTSERVLIGTTSAVIMGNGGIALKGADGRIDASGGGGPAALFDRRTNDGDIVGLYKAGTVVGSIGVTSGDQIYIGRSTGSQGIKLKNSALLPSSNAGADADNSKDLGTSSARWKDLYLSGGLKVGGTGTANTLDDYEEGTFNVLISTDSTYGGETQSGVYTKIGDICFFQIRFSRSGTLNSGVNARCSLPFTSANNGVQASGFRGSVENIDTSMVGIGGTIAANNTILYLNEMNAATTGYNVNGNDLGANFQIQIQGFYKTS